MTYRAEAWDELAPPCGSTRRPEGPSLRFVVLDGLAKPAILADPDPETLRAAYQAVIQEVRS